mgnify:CR=1 FL=1
MIDLANTISDVKAKILSAAEQRFRHYGYNKTTMAELAGDLGMSPANLYRYFNSKEEIGAACVLRCFRDSEAILRGVVAAQNISAQQKLHQFVLAKFEHIYSEATENPRIHELVELILQDRTDLLYSQKQLVQSLIAEILAEGNRRGEFAVQDLVTTAETITSATVLFCVPIFIHLFPKEKFEIMLENVVDLIVTGIQKR